jgi:polyhydroxyalkanoate synthesis regulator phasin
MAKSEKAKASKGASKGKSKRSKRGRERGAESVRSAVERTFQATAGQAQVTRERAQELVDELSGATTRVREVLEDLRVATGEDVKALEAKIRKLERRIAALEKDRAPAKRAPARRASAKRAPSPSPAKPAGAKSPPSRPSA